MWTVRSLFPATQRARQQRHFKGWWGAFQEGWIAHWQILQQGPPSYFSVAGNEQFSFCNSRGGHFEPHWFGKWAQSAQLYISRGCLSLFCILHRVGILQPSPRAPVYYRPNQYTEQNIEHEQNTEHDVLKLVLQPPAHLYIIVPTCSHWTKHYDANVLETYSTCILCCTCMAMLPIDWRKHWGANIAISWSWGVKVVVPQTDMDDNNH